ncbi:hypothetical protein NBRC3280_3220 [Acetobacter pasteurianus NBRC 3280]|uniref:Uncharacterized protein n=1 Tax=Acetobacter pasteurianus NBRC 3278 TaxID=1226660 RepID=A0A401X8V5_ACEPA|nr:hypothetical protein NBRC3222_1524 [Acetobacter pasteurianus NBRC 3222]GCD60637.1 hypothetical protein NBRC3277_3212 [Acetobacter pasteurianus NBRC 3277]GCD64183.1 hypothetical protein NBRC3278_3276 [Acetobacter pasteurianus NBRC 3278]GCD70585.1 hypothetical protein NBRC3280_3220 [Acetobacter pasteurianus NBRC 3280]
MIGGHRQPNGEAQAGEMALRPNKTDSRVRRRSRIAAWNIAIDQVDQRYPVTLPEAGRPWLDQHRTAVLREQRHIVDVEA